MCFNYLGYQRTSSPPKYVADRCEHGNKLFRNYNLTASLDAPGSSWDSFGLFMLLLRASSGHRFRLLSRLCLFRFLEKPLSFRYTCFAFRYLELHPFEIVSFRVVYICNKVFNFLCFLLVLLSRFSSATTLFCEYVSKWFSHFSKVFFIVFFFLTCVAHVLA